MYDVIYYRIAHKERFNGNLRPQNPHAGSVRVLKIDGYRSMLFGENTTRSQQADRPLNKNKDVLLDLKEAISYKILAQVGASEECWKKVNDFVNF